MGSLTSPLASAAPLIVYRKPISHEDVKSASKMGKAGELEALKPEKPTMTCRMEKK